MAFENNPIAPFAGVLKESQWAPPARLAELQHRLLGRLVRHAAAETAIYGERLRPVMGSDGEFQPARWEELPIVHRRDLQESQDGFLARSIPAGAGATTMHSTSGSTGRSMVFPVNSALSAVSGALIERAHDWVGADRDLPYVTISVPREPDPFRVEGAIRRRWSWLGGEGLHGVMSIEAPISAQLDFLDRVGPAYLRTYTTNAVALAKAGKGRPWARTIRHVFAFGEVLEDDHVAAIRDCLGVGVTSFYGSEEAGQMATLCPHSGDFHIASEVVHVELLREDGSPCAPGESGRVVVTPFYAYAMPLIRYDQGDHAVLGDRPCGCGRTLPTMRRILGRSRDMFVLPNGDRIWPRLSETLMLRHLPALQRQIVQHAPDRIELRYVHDGSDRQPDEPALAALFKARYAPEVELTVTRCDDIPRSPGGKFREFVCLVE